MVPYLLLDIVHKFRMQLEIILGIISALTDAFTPIREPGAALFHDIRFYGKIQNIAFAGDPGTEHDVKFRFFKRRSHFILDDLDADMVADHFAALL